MDLKFKENLQPLTLGVEMEIQLINKNTLNLEPASEHILKELANSPKFVKEMFQSTIEIISEPQENVHLIKNDLLHSVVQLEKIINRHDIVLASTGTHPKADYNKRLISNSSRYNKILERNQWLIRRMAVYGLHIHLGMRNGDECMRFMHFFKNFIPHFIALSASSPYWKGKDTGLDASRPTVYEAHPTAGFPIFRKNWSSFNQLFNELIDSSCIESMKDLWWDIRPSPGYGTLEIRICDMPPTMEELLSIVSLVHMLGVWYEKLNDDEKNSFLTPSDSWIYRENKWRALRFGINANLIKPNPIKQICLREDLLFWLKELQPISKHFKYEAYIELIENIIIKGNSASRQRIAFSSTSSMEKVIIQNIEEFKIRKPLWF